MCPRFSGALYGAGMLVACGYSRLPTGGYEQPAARRETAVSAVFGWHERCASPPGHDLESPFWSRVEGNTSRVEGPKNQ